MPGIATAVSFSDPAMGVLHSNKLMIRFESIYESLNGEATYEVKIDLAAASAS